MVLRCSIQKWHLIQRYEIDRLAPSRVMVLRWSFQEVDVANLARAEPDKCSGEADMSKDTSGLESPEELRRSWITHPVRKASKLESSLEAGEVALPKEDMSRHHPRKDKSTIPPDQHTTPKRKGKELMKQDEAIKGATQPEKI
ncbi:hypothetical protein Tco_0983183 [Tanacetum coccineum]